MVHVSSTVWLQAAIGVFYLVGAVCWIANSVWSGWPSGTAAVDDYVTGITAVVGALLFHLGAMCQVWEALNNNSKRPTPGFTRLPSCPPKEPWLDPPDLGSFTDSPADDCGIGITPQTAAALRRTLTGASADSSELQLSEMGGSPTGGSSTNLQHLQEWPEDCTTPLPDDCPRLLGPAGDDARQQQQQQQAPHANVSGTPQQHRPAAAASSRGGTSSSSSSAGSRSPALMVFRQRSAQHSGSCAAADDTMHSPSKPRAWAAGPAGGWVWWEWRPHDLAFRAAFVQVVGTTIFFAACVCGFPGVLQTNYSAGDWMLWDAFFWAPFLAGSCLFITSGLLSVRECQGCWCKPQPWSQAWWMHVANTVGSIGFWLCSFFGFFAHPAQMFQRWGMAFSCLWGSCCFAVAAWLQLLLACSPLAV